jgi:antirestriction protein ArdC
MAMQSIKDTYQRITDTIVEQLEAGTKPWIRRAPIGTCT